MFSRPMRISCSLRETRPTMKDFSTKERWSDNRPAPAARYSRFQDPALKSTVRLATLALCALATLAGVNIWQARTSISLAEAERLESCSALTIDLRATEEICSDWKQFAFESDRAVDQRSQRQTGKPWNEDVLGASRSSLDALFANLRSQIENSEETTSALREVATENAWTSLLIAGCAGLVILFVAFRQFQNSEPGSLGSRSENDLADQETSVEDQSLSAELAQIFHDSPAEIVFFHQETLGVEFANEGALRATGFSRESLLQMHVDQLITPLPRKQLVHLLNPLATDEKLVLELRAHQTTASGEPQPVQISLHKSCFQGIPVYVAVIANLPEHWLQENAISQQQRLESASHLAAGIAHDINSPMQFVLSNVEYLRESVPRVFRVVDHLSEMFGSETLSTSAEQRVQHLENSLEQAHYAHLKDQTHEALDECAVGVRRVIEVIRTMRSLTQTCEVSKTRAQINEIVHAASVQRRSHWMAHAELVLHLASDLPLVSCVPQEVQKVFCHLIENASDAIAARRNAGEFGLILVETYQRDSHVVVEFRDTGIGISDEHLPKIFDPYFTTKEVGEGSGQGLAISHLIVVQNHGGSIQVESHPGEGTTFRVRWPLTEQTVPTAASLSGATSG